jgi:hypothetical protein
MVLFHDEYLAYISRAINKVHLILITSCKKMPILTYTPLDNVSTKTCLKKNA